MKFKATGQVPNEYSMELAKNNIAGAGREFKFGRSQTITTTESVIWDGGGDYTFLTSAGVVSLVSDNINDTAAGSGLRTATIYGHNLLNMPIEETLTLNGTTAVTTTLEFYRVHRIMGLTHGGTSAISGGNLGTLTATVGGTTVAKVLPNKGQTLMAVYTTPADKYGFIKNLFFSCGQGKQVDFNLKYRNGPTGDYCFSTKFELELYQYALPIVLPDPIIVPNKTDIVVTAVTDVGTVTGSAVFGIRLLDFEE